MSSGNVADVVGKAEVMEREELIVVAQQLRDGIQAVRQSLGYSDEHPLMEAALDALFEVDNFLRK